MSNKPELVVGQILYSLNVGGAARHQEQILTPVTVVKIGRKYFTIAERRYIDRDYLHIQCHLDDWREKSDYSYFKLYLTEQEYFDKKESAVICKEIGDTFTYGRNLRNLSLGILRRIQKLIDDK